MKKIVIIFSMIFAICTMNAEEAIKGFDNGMQYKSGTEVEFTFDGVQINIESKASRNTQQRC
jgi:preprotein translocase subunit SecF